VYNFETKLRGSLLNFTHLVGGVLYQEQQQKSPAEQSVGLFV
jgi:hypothetical protein